MEDDPVCHISIETVMGQVVQLGPMEYPESLERCRANQAFDFLGAGMHFNHNLTQMVEWKGQAVFGKEEEHKPFHFLCKADLKAGKLLLSFLIPSTTGLFC